MNRKALITVIGLLAITLAVGIYLFARRKSSEDSDSESRVNIAKMAQKETRQGKGSKGNWGKYQAKHIQYIIASSLLKTQTEIAHKEMDIYEFIDNVNSCLDCITKNFAAKYSYEYTLEHVQNMGEDKDFDQWFKNLYTTCDCNDPLGKLLAKLLREVWTNKVVEVCPEAEREIMECINKIKVADFNEPNAVDNFYQMLEACVGKSCPQLLDKK